MEFNSGNLKIATTKLFSIDEVDKQKELILRATVNAISGGQGFKLHMQNKLSNQTICCFKINIKCNIRCHNILCLVQKVKSKYVYNDII